MNRSSLLGAALVIAGCATASSTAFYPLAELRALDTAEDHAELLQRAHEVAPSARTEEWRALVERAAVASISEFKVKSARDAEAALATVEATHARFPSLRRSTGWLQRRADVAVAAFPYTVSSGNTQEWAERIVAFARTDTRTPHLAQRLAEEVVLTRYIPSVASGLIELAMQRDGQAACSSAAVQKAALSSAEDGAELEAVTGPCWKSLEPKLVELLRAATTRTDKLKLCKVLLAHGDAKALAPLCTFE